MAFLIKRPSSGVRDEHLKCVTGVFQEVDSVVNGFRPERTHRPHIVVQVRLGNRVADVPFLVDTGADSTLLSPTAAWTLLESDYLQIDFQEDQLAAVSAGIGGYARSVHRPALITLVADDGTSLAFRAPIGIAEPIGQPGEAGNWGAPSLLGRDWLRFFELHLDYHPGPRVELWYDQRAAEEELKRMERWIQMLEDHKRSQ